MNAEIVPDAIGLVPAIPLMGALPYDRDCRVKPGNDSSRYLGTSPRTVIRCMTRRWPW